MLKQNLLRSAAGLTISGICAKTVDFLFRAYYSTRLGSEGMGIFSLVFSFHTLILTVATGGLGVAVSKTVSSHYACNQYGSVRKAMNMALLAVIILSSTVIFAVCFFAKEISSSFLKEPRATQSIVFLSPSILFMSISYCIKGYFYASRKVSIPAFSEFLEQAVKISLIIFLLKNWLPLGIERGCEAVFLGITIGEFSSCLFLSVFYLGHIRKFKMHTPPENPIPGLVKIAVPAMITSLAGSFLRTREDVLIVTALKNSGLDHVSALSQYGTLKGMVMPLIVFPLSLLSSFFTLLVPEISRAQGMSDHNRLTSLISKIYRFTAFGGFMVAVIFVLFAKPLAQWVYSAPQIYKSVKIIALLSPIMFFDSISTGMLSGLGKQTTLLFLSLSDSALRIFMIWALVPSMGVDALYIMIIASNLFTATLSFSSVMKNTHIPYEISAWLLKHLATALATYITINSLGTFFNIYSDIYTTIFSMFFTLGIFVLYSSCLYKTLRNDLRWLTRRMVAQ